MDHTTVILVSLLALIIVAAVVFAIVWSRKLEAKLQEQTDKALQQAMLEMTTVDLVNKNIGELRQDVAERLGRIDEAQRNISELGVSINDLKTVLKGNQTRGRYGEMQLKLLLENTFANTRGLYAEQYSIKGDNVRPDAVVFLPEPDKLLCIDSKFPFSEYQEMLMDDIPDERRSSLKTQFKAAVKSHITIIKNKYIIEGETSPYAVMFIPNDGVFYYIHLEMYELVEYARSVNVILSSPGTLQPILATISSFWREYKRNENLKEISKQIKELNTAFRVFHKSWDPFKNSFEDSHNKFQKIQEELQRLDDKLQRIANSEPEEEA
ncbi:DNA recombination protein RmuC [bacterium]|nr:DNA recombination protein RmuC [bacterium]